MSRVGKRPLFVKEGTNTTGHSRPFALWMVVRFHRLDVDVGFTVEALDEPPAWVGDKDGQRLVVPRVLGPGRRRARPDRDVPGEQVGGQDRGLWYYKSLTILIANHAGGAYEGFDGEPDVDIDAVDLTTIHKAKGLEWPVVFVPSLTNKGRFPTRLMGAHRNWLVPRDKFDAARYEGCDADERRLFYVAITRARDWLSLSRHDHVTKNSVRPSPYYEDMLRYEIDHDLPVPEDVPALGEQAHGPVTLTFSELAAYDACGLAYRLRNLLGFQPTLAPELGYGKAVHHVLRTVAERTMATGEVPDQDVLDEILDQDFFLPAANKQGHREMKQAARRIVHFYATEHADDLRRVWQTERPFELHLDGITITGRADVILDHEGDVVTSLAIVDYKTSVAAEGDHDLQLQVYADAGRREGLDVRGAYVHDLRGRQRTASRRVAGNHQGRRDEGDRHRPPAARARLLPAPRPWLRPMRRTGPVRHGVVAPRGPADAQQGVCPWSRGGRTLLSVATNERRGAHPTGRSAARGLSVPGERVKLWRGLGRGFRRVGSWPINSWRAA